MSAASNRAGGDAGDRKFLMTTSWDDGHPLDFRVAELLTRYGLTGTFYVPRSSQRQVMKAARMRELSGTFEIGAHTLDHVHLNRVTPGEARRQIAESRGWIEDATGTECQAFCFPGGIFRGQHLEMARDAGFVTARTVELLSVRAPRLTNGLYLLPTTVQVFPHTWKGYARNFLRRNTLRRAVSAKVFLRTRAWPELAKDLFELARNEGGVFHLWGHSWEIAENEQWKQLEEFLGFAAERLGEAQSVCNSALAKLGTGSAGKRAGRREVLAGHERRERPAEKEPIELGAPPEPAIEDIALDALSDEDRSRLGSKSRDWLGSLGFCQWHCNPPAERAMYLRNAAGGIEEACFYRRTNWLRRFSQIEVLGPLSAQSPLLRALKSRYAPDLVSTSFERAPASNEAPNNWIARDVQKTSEDLCIELPSRLAEYLQSLGNKAQRQLPYYVRRLEREWGSKWSFETRHGAAILRDDFNNLVRLNQQRMNSKGRRSLWTTELLERRWEYVRKEGWFCAGSIEGRLAAGIVFFVTGGEAYLSLMAHDPRFDRLNLGNICLWLMLEHCIQQGYGRAHLLWGRSFYKQQFHASEHPLYRTTWIANRTAAFLWKAGKALAAPQVARFLQKAVRKAVWLLDRTQQHGNSSGRANSNARGNLPCQTAVRAGAFGFPAELVRILLCPADGSRLSLAEPFKSPKISNGEVRCAKCGARFEIREGILRILPQQTALQALAQLEQESRDAGAEAYDSHCRDWEVAVELAALSQQCVGIENKAVLDLACGTGRLTLPLFAGARAVVAADLSEESLRVFSRKLGNNSNFGLVWADVTRLQVKACYFHIVLSTQLFEHLPTPEDRRRFVAAAHAALKPGGMFYLTSYYYSALRRLLRRPQEGLHGSSIFYRRFTLEELRGALKEHFEILRLQPLQIDPRLLPISSPLVRPVAFALERTPLPRLIGQLAFVKARRPAAAGRSNLRAGS